MWCYKGGLPFVNVADLIMVLSLIFVKDIKSRAFTLLNEEFVAVRNCSPTCIQADLKLFICKEFPLVMWLDCWLDMKKVDLSWILFDLTHFFPSTERVRVSLPGRPRSLAL